MWSATSEFEVLVAIADFPVHIGAGHWQGRLTELFGELYEGLRPAQIDEIMLHGVLTEPGQVGTRHELHRNLTTKARIDKAFERVGFHDANFLDAHVKSREGFEATIFANYVAGDKDFSELDRSLFGVLADLGSVALTGRLP